ncbi:MAG TPA: DUF3883 domain-containing protein [Candidatus Angelobacter sp.]|nr:DUF3883 domain-containing protein [Candidatus Angelobacter sp.]
MSVASGWLTGVRMQRLQDILILLSTFPPGTSLSEMLRSLWQRCGGPLEEISQLVMLLADLKCVKLDKDAAIRTPIGDKVAKALKSGKRELFALTLIRAGYFHDQARVLIESGSIQANGNLHCSLRVSRTGAPQLIGLLSVWDMVQTFPEVVVPADLLQELNTVWALLPPPIALPKWAAERKEIGNRAEMYSVQFERTRLSTSAIFWVAKDSDELGWDIEDRSVTPHRCIEVKGRRDDEVIFFFSDNEWQKASTLGPLYEVHFWGTIDLGCDPATEYARLRAKGYPLIVRNISAQIGVKWEATAVRWKITPKP